MLIAGEKLNSSIPSVQKAMESRDEEKIREMIISQIENKADYLDVNTALTGNEEDTMNWIIELIQDYPGIGIMIDSTRPDTVNKCVKTIKDRRIIINSVTLTERLELVNTAKAYNTGIVALPLGNKMPKSIEERINNAYVLIDKIIKEGISPDKIYLDILVEALASNKHGAVHAIETLKAVKKSYTNIKTICGLSNISFGLPVRNHINCAFLTAAIYNGLDSAILDNTAKSVMDTLYSALAVSGNDDYCLDYIGYIRGTV